MKQIGLFIVVFFLSGSLLAQRNRNNTPEDADDDIIDSKTLAYGATTNTNSGLLGGFVLRSSTPVGKRGSLPIHRYLALELVNVKHPKESLRRTVPGNRFAFGKTNYLFTIRPEYGREWFFFNKGNDNGIGLSGILAVGPSFGIEKPYYLRYNAGNQESMQVIVYDPDIHTDITRITGAASIWQGFLRNAGFVPGFHLKGALNLDMSTFGDKITGFELGATAEFFTRSPEIMNPKITGSPRSFVSAYLTLYFGNKKLIKR